MSNLAIVTIGYNRPQCMLRLLNSLKASDYKGDTVPLIISIDNSGSDEVYKVADSFKWPHGEKIIKTYNERMGLRKHVLTCGQLTEKYENIIVFEDDIFVSPGFYNFAKQAVEKYKNNDEVAGISLYNHLWNVNCNRPFHPANDGYDVYFLQYAQSWGQIWMKDQWAAFVNWYEDHSSREVDGEDVPKIVRSWPKTSWLKYHINYVIDTNKYFVYPRVSLSTNFGDIGQHAVEKNNDYQVNLQMNCDMLYRMPDLKDNCRKYDGFFEATNLAKVLGLEDKDLCADLYGEKGSNIGRKYLLTMEQIDYKIIKSFGLNLRPHDLNIELNIEGNDIYLYDTEVKEVFNGKSIVDTEIIKTSYDIKALSNKKIANLLKYRIRMKVRKKVLHKR